MYQVRRGRDEAKTATEYNKHLFFLLVGKSDRNALADDPEPERRNQIVLKKIQFEIMT